MGWRYRKSINLGGGFRINLSKSGIGYSWGFPGYRHTHSTNGTERRTYSIPGTGISYVDSTKNRKNNYNDSGNNYNQDNKLITGDTIYYQNSNISNMGKGDEILKQINKLRTIDILANICLITIVLFPIGILLKILISQKWKIDLTYEMDDINQKKYNALNEFLLELKNNKKLWQIGSSTKVYNTKYNAGASNNVSRQTISLVKKMPWYINHNIDVYCLNLTNEKIFFTPDRMLIFKKIGGVGCRKYNDMIAGFNTTNFVETEIVPRDTEIVRYTWRYVNKSGGPDKRFNNNRQIPVCRYGEISLTSEDGINILLECSNHNLIYAIQDKFKEFVNYHNKIISANGYKEEYELEDDIDYSNDVNFANNTSTNQNKEKIFDSNDKWNNFNKEDFDESNNSEVANELIDQPVLVEQSKGQEINPPSTKNYNVNNNSNNNKNTIATKSSKETIFTILCYLQVVFASFIVIGCISDKMIYGTVMWLLVILIFIPKIKEILCSKNNFINKYIIPIKIVVVILAICSFATLTNQYEGTWINDNGETINLDSTYIKYNDSNNINQKSPYSNKKIEDASYDYVFEISGKYNNENVTFRYYKKNSNESLCIFENNECIINFKKNQNK